MSSLSTDKPLTEIAAHLRLAITRTARRLRQEANPELGPSSASALASVERRGPLTPSELAEIEQVKRPTATRVLAALEAQGLITRTQDPEDARSAIVSITSQGRALLRRLRSRKTAYLATRMHELEPDEVAALERAAEILESLLEGERGGRRA